MAAFKVKDDFRITDEHPVRFLASGAFYTAGQTISGLTGAEASELLKLAPEGTFEPVDEEAQSIATYVVNLRGKLSASGTVRNKE